MFVALYGQFAINLCLLIYMCVQVYKNYSLEVQMRTVFRRLERATRILTIKQQETNDDVEQLKKNLARVMVQTSRELDALHDKKGG